MKIKRLKKKLSLNTGTVSNLNKEKMKAVIGGECWTEGVTCAFCNTIVSCSPENCIQCRPTDWDCPTYFC